MTDKEVNVITKELVKAIPCETCPIKCDDGSYLSCHKAIKEWIKSIVKEVKE